MAPKMNVHLDRLYQRYGWTGGKYRTLMDHIIQQNAESLYRAVGRLKVAKFRTHAQSRLGSQFKAVALPDVTEVIPKQSVFIRKGAEQGKLMADDLRRKLSDDLRQLMLEHRSKTGLPTYVRRRGEKKGRVSEELAKEFEAKIRSTFAGWTQRDPEIGVPPNVRTIAVTETQAAVNEVKAAYFHRMAAKNPEAQALKRWKHNPHRSKEPREGHAEVDGKTIPIDELFDVPRYDAEGNLVAVVRMDHPHDPNGAAEDVINCHCDVDYLMRIPTKSEQVMEQQLARLTEI